MLGVKHVGGGVRAGLAQLRKVELRGHCEGRD